METDTVAPAIDPTLLALLSIFGGVLVTVGAGLLGAWIQGRREHRTWLRAERLTAYAAFLSVVEDAAGAMVFRRLRHPSVAKIAEEMQRSMASVLLVGPKEVSKAGTKMRQHVLKPMVSTWDPADMDSWVQKWRLLRFEYVERAQDALGIKTPK